MPCSKCGKREEISRPDAGQWGPILWTVLHGLSVKRTSLDSYQLRTLKTKWKLLLETLPNIIPCQECKDHVLAYIKNNSYMGINSEEDFSNWLYQLHEDVNRQLGKPSFDKGKLFETYSTIDLRATLLKYEKLMDQSTIIGDVSLLSWGKMKTVFLFMFSFYNL